MEQALIRELEMPLPTLHPRERMRRLTAFNNYFNLFPGVCSASGEKLIQMFRPGAPFPIYSMQYWWNGDWDAMSFGRAYDFTRDFFDQLMELRNVVPQAALSVNYLTNENCSYVNGMSYSKNCYLCFLCVHCEDCLYCNSTWRSKDCLDCSSTYDCELCNDCIFAANCYNLLYSFNCSGCRDSAFLWNCVGCSDCFGCANLRRASHCYFNQQLSKEEYTRRIAQHRLDCHDEVESLREKFHSFARQFPQPALRGASSVDCTGDFLEHCARSQRCFDCSELEDCFNCIKVAKGKNCADLYSWGAGSEFIYNCSRVGTGASRVKCSYLVYSGSNEVEYSMTCVGCKDCFGCIGLRNKQYCILNKQLGKGEYFELRRRIINQMSAGNTVQRGRGYGEYFPYELAFTPYVDSDAMVFFPLAENGAAAVGVPWVAPLPEVERYGGGVDLPDSADEISEQLAGVVLKCPDTHRIFRYGKRELEVFKRRRIPLPRRHWKTRIERRTALANHPELYSDISARSGAPLVSSFPPESGWSVWSREEFEAEFNS